MSKIYKPQIGIVMGDPAGVGPEVLAKALKRFGKYPKAHFLVLGDRRLITRSLPWAKKRLSKHFWFFDPTRYKGPPPKPGRPTRQSAKLSLAWLKEGVRLACHGDFDALVTAPLNKHELARVGFEYPGVTEYLIHQSRAKQGVMIFLGGAFRVALVTRHMPLKEISRAITKSSVLNTITLSTSFIQKKFKIKQPRIGVLGLNPHAGESGRTGQEERSTILPAIKSARRKGIRVEGPLSPDSAFYQAKKNPYDLIVAMYHDQGLIPLKMLSFEKAVNVTIGLPFIRTSPDHGTAFDIAGKGTANEEAMYQAIRWAMRLSESS
jgi:4-hydroxythreonine-4-phosphate dehydrogenase